MAELTPKQKKFCLEYMIDLNATQAAIRAGYSEKTANRIATENLSKLDIQAYLNTLRTKQEQRTEITADKVLRELANIAFANGTDFANVVEKTYLEKKFDEDGNFIEEVEKTYKAVELVNTDELPKEKQAAISCVKHTRNGINIETHDKVKALELIGRHLAMFTDKVDVGNKDDKPFQISVEDKRLLENISKRLDKDV